MCATHPPGSSDEHQPIRPSDFITNLRQPGPLSWKLRRIWANLGIQRQPAPELLRQRRRARMLNASAEPRSGHSSVKGSAFKRTPLPDSLLQR